MTSTMTTELNDLLLHAASNGNAVRLTQCLAMGAQPNHQGTNGHTALMLAIIGTLPSLNEGPKMGDYRISSVRDAGTTP